MREEFADVSHRIVARLVQVRMLPLASEGNGKAEGNISGVAKQCVALPLTAVDHAEPFPPFSAEMKREVAQIIVMAAASPKLTASPFPTTSINLTVDL